MRLHLSLSGRNQRQNLSIFLDVLDFGAAVVSKECVNDTSATYSLIVDHSIKSSLQVLWAVPVEQGVCIRCSCFRHSRGIYEKNGSSVTDGCSLVG